MRRRAGIVAIVAVAMLCTAGTAQAAEVKQPRNQAPAWFTPELRALVDASGIRGVPMDEPAITDVCPGVAIHEGGVGTGTCLVYPYGCTANFVYSSAGGGTAPAVADGSLYLGTAGHCVDKVGEAVYGAVSTPGVGPMIKRIGTVSKRVEKYPDNGELHDFAAIQIDKGLRVDPASPVGGPQGIYDGCDVGQPLKYYGNGYEAAVAQGKPGGGVALNWLSDAYGDAGTSFGGDSGSGVLHADGRAVGDLTATALLYPPYLPGEVIGSRVTWILGFLGGSLVNANGTLTRDTTSPCGSSSAGAGGGGKPDKGGKGGKGGRRGKGPA
jgi:hypothetical protein